MPDLIRHPVPTWIPAFAGMTILSNLTAGVISNPDEPEKRKARSKKTEHQKSIFHLFHSAFDVGSLLFDVFFFEHQSLFRLCFPGYIIKNFPAKFNFIYPLFSKVAPEWNIEPRNLIIKGKGVFLFI